MPITSAGLLLFRRCRSGAEVFLVHPGGPFWQDKDDGAWSLPKGLQEPGEDLLATARREFHEETGFPAVGCFHSLGHQRQASGKIVHAWAFEGNVDPARLRSNTFRMEWPPHSGSFECFPEVDRGEWFAMPDARRKIRRGQKPFLDALEALINAGSLQPQSLPTPSALRQWIPATGT